MIGQSGISCLFFFEEFRIATALFSTDLKGGFFFFLVVRIDVAGVEDF